MAPTHHPCRPGRWRELTPTGPKGRFLLWVDAVGGYLVCLDDRIVLGRAGPDSHADIPLMGDLSRNHATLVRNGEGYLLQAHHASFVNGKPVVDQAVLHDGDVIRLGSTVELEFRQPSPVSATARLSIVSRHRLPLAVDGVLLMAETCIVGEALAGAHPGPGAQEPGRPVPPGRCAVVPGRRRLRRRRPNLRVPRSSDLAVQRAGRRFLVQSGTSGKSAGVASEPHCRGLAALVEVGCSGKHRSISETVLAGRDRLLCGSCITDELRRLKNYLART